MRKLFFSISLVLTGLMTGCVDKNEPVDADSKPEWLGSSIYQELKNPDQSKLTGSFATYLRLIDDLGESETLNRTGSKTVFPANDEAFQRFFQQNEWGVTSYEQLSNAQKKLLLYNSMLDNALLVDMLSNISNTSDPTNPIVLKGHAMKHQTNVSVIDTIQFIGTGADMPQNNVYWDKFRDRGIHIVSDATRPMMVHLTREHMLNNNITASTGDENSDFALLTGTPYQKGCAYVFNNGMKLNSQTGKYNSNIICQNGYIHQMEDVIVPPGNMAQVLRKDNETSYFSRMLDYYCAPYYNASVTNDYNAWALANGKATIDSIFTLRYLNNQTGHAQNTDPNGNIVTGNSLLDFDPGWNQYSPQQSTSAIEYALNDVGVMLVPTDQAVKNFFLQGGDGAYLIDLYGSKANTEQNLNENLDTLKSLRPDIIIDFLRLLMKPSFVNAVPSKFETLQNDAQEYMGVKTELLHKKGDGNYDIKFANNGVVYKLDELIAPDKYQSVMAPSTVYPDMQVMNWMASETKHDRLGLDFSYYLLAMSANYAFFVPDDEAFGQYFVDVTSLGRTQPQALRLYYGSTGTAAATLHCEAYKYDPKTNEVGDRIGEVSIATVKSLLIDLLNMHTVVLGENEKVGTNNYYKTKHGGEIYVDGGGVGNHVVSGQQIDNGVTAPEIETVYEEKNGTAFRINHVIESPRNSVYSVLAGEERFSEFLEACNGFSSTDLLAWAGISSAVNDFGTTEQDAYVIFTTNNKNAYPTSTSDAQKAQPNCLDFNVKMFNTYNYTLYAPNNEAMQKAYAAGLPRWSDIVALYEKYADDENADPAEVEAAQQKAKQMIRTLKDFTRYHFQSSSVYADNVVEGGRFQSLRTDELGLATEMQVSGGNGHIEVVDAAGVTHIVDGKNSAKITNKMARDYWFTSSRSTATEIYTSSFCVIHEIDEALNVYEQTN